MLLLVLFKVYYKQMMKKTTIILVVALLASCHGRQDVEEKTEPSAVQQQMIEEGWRLGNPNEGDLPDEYGVTAQMGIVDNYFDIELGGDADMVVKIVDIETGRTARYLFVPHNSRTTINEIPNGKYYLKFAYGNDWMSRSNGIHTDGKFTRNVVYEKSDDYFDFGNAGSLESLSYSLKIRVERDQRYEDFSTSTITEEEFNK